MSILEFTLKSVSSIFCGLETKADLFVKKINALLDMEQLQWSLPAYIGTQRQEQAQFWGGSQ